MNIFKNNIYSTCCGALQMHTVFVFVDVIGTSLLLLKSQKNN